MNFLATYWLLLIKGIEITTAAWLIAGICSLTIGGLLGVLSCQSLTFKKTALVIRFCIFIIKGIPAYVQILIAYFVLPALFNCSIPAFAAATGALALCSSGYVTEIIRAGMNGIPQGQWDAAFVLGYSRLQTVWYIVGPQALYASMPALIGELEQLLKSTSLLATIGVMELTRAGMNIISRELNPLPVYLCIACVYVLFSAVLALVGFLVERKAARYGYR